MILLGAFLMIGITLSIKNYQEDMLTQCAHLQVQEVLARHNKNTQILLTNGKTMFINRTNIHVGDNVDYCGG